MSGSDVGPLGRPFHQNMFQIKSFVADQSDQWRTQGRTPRKNWVDV